MQCPSCGTDLPVDARFCIECGLALPQAATDATIKLPAAEPAFACRECGAANPAGAIFCVRCGRRHSSPVQPRIATPAQLTRTPAQPQHRRAWRGGPGPALFFIALAGLLIFGKTFILPGILVLVGISVFIREAGRGRPFAGLSFMTWMFGLLIALAVPRLFLPAILATIGVTILIDAIRRSAHQP